MLTDLLLEEKFFAVLTGLDAEIAEKVASSGCRHCGGPLYQANYERKPRGAQIAVVREAFRCGTRCAAVEGLPQTGAAAVVEVSGTTGLHRRRGTASQRGGSAPVGASGRTCRDRRSGADAPALGALVARHVSTKLDVDRAQGAVRPTASGRDRTSQFVARASRF